MDMKEFLSKLSPEELAMLKTNTDLHNRAKTVVLNTVYSQLLDGKAEIDSRGLFSIASAMVYVAIGIVTVPTRPSPEAQAELLDKLLSYTRDAIALTLVEEKNGCVPPAAARRH